MAYAGPSMGGFYKCNRSHFDNKKMGNFFTYKKIENRKYPKYCNLTPS